MSGRLTDSFESFATAPRSKESSTVSLLNKSSQMQNESKLYTDYEKKLISSEYDSIRSKLISSSSQLNESDLTPRITLKMIDKDVKQGDMAIFACEFYSKSKVSIINWYFNGTLIQNQMNQGKYMFRNDEHRSVLCIMNINFEDSGLYEIRIENSYGFVSSSAKLTVYQSKI